MECCLGGCLVALAGFGAAGRAKLQKGGIIRPPKQGPLAGVKVVDVSVAIAGPWCTALLAEMGAEVIKVESLDLPDACRGLGNSPAPGMAGSAATTSRGKQSIILDLKQEAGKEVFMKMVQECDIVVQNYRPGAVKRLGIDYESLLEVNPDIIYVSSSGYGQSGPLSSSRIYDPVIQAMAGMAAVQGKDPTGNPPACKLVAQAIADKTTAQTSCQAILSALAAREMGRGGQHIDVSMLDVALAWMWPDGFLNHTWVGTGCAEAAGVVDQLVAQTPVPHFNSKEEAFQEMDRLSILMKPQHALFGKFKACKFPIHFAQTPVSKAGAPAPPMLGEHTAKLLRETGYSKQEIEQLLDTKAAVSTKSLLVMKKEEKKAKIFNYVEKLQGGFPTFKKISYRRLQEKKAETAEFKSAARVQRGISLRDATGSHMGGPLANIKVLDCTSFVAGPMAACMLADQGADVTKVEAAGCPDSSRSYGQVPVKNMGSVHMVLNRNKKSIVIDPEKKEGREVLMKLASDADIILIDAESSFIKAGLTYGAIKKMSPASIYISLKKTPEITCQALSGMLSHQKDLKNDPCVVQFTVAEKNAAMYMASAASASLFARETGRGGQYVEVDMLTAAFHYCFTDVFWTHIWETPKATPTFVDITSAYKLLTTKGDQISFFSGALSDKEWESLTQVFMEKYKVVAPLSDEQREKWKTITARIKDIDAIWKILEDFVDKPKTTYAEFSKLAQEADLINGKARNLLEVLDGPQVKHNRIIGEYSVPGIGKVRLVQPVAMFSRMPASIRTMASDLGADSEKVLEGLGYDANNICLLLQSGAVQKAKSSEI